MSVAQIRSLKSIFSESILRARGVAGLTRLPVTEEIAGSNPVGSARIRKSPLWWFFYSDESLIQIRIGEE